METNNRTATSVSTRGRLWPGARWSRIRIALILIFCLSTCLLGSVPTLADEQESAPVVLAVVNGDTVYTSDLDRALISAHRSMRSSERMKYDYERLLTRLVNDRLIVQEAVAMGMNEDSRLIDEIEDQRMANATRLWVADNFKRDLDIPEDTIQSYFQKHFARVQMRVITSRDSSVLADARRAVLNGADMDSVARAISIDNYSTMGGLHKPTWHVEVEPVLRALSDSLQIGALSSVFPYRSVFALARVERIVPANQEERPSVQPQIEAFLKRQENERQWNEFLEPLRKRFPVVVDSTVFDRIWADSASLFTPTFSTGTQDPVLRIGDSTIVTELEFRSEVAHNAMNAATTPFPDLVDQSLKKLGEKHILMLAASADGYMDRPDILAARDRSMDSALVEAYLAETVSPRIVFSRAEFAEYYDEHPEEFRRPDEVRFDQMTVDSQSTAMEIYNRLLEGADFAFLGRSYHAEMPQSSMPSEFVPVTSLPESIRNEVDTLDIGGYTRPRETASGWLILRLTGRKDGAPLPLEESETRIRSIMYQKKFDDELDSVLAILRANSTIEYNDKGIQEYFGSGS